MIKKFNFVYLTTNIVNNEQYVGDHSTNNLKDGYIGSGKYLKNAIKKYGKDKFTTSILEFCDTKEEAFILQEYYITQYNSLIPNGYNISPSGGVWRPGGIHNEETKIKLRGSNPKKACKGEKNGMYGQGYKITGEKNGRFGKILSNDVKKSFGRNQKGENNVFYNKTHSNETLSKISSTLKSIPKVVCPHCNILVDPSNYKRWHGDKCKLNKGDH